LCFQCILKSILHKKTSNKFLICHYTLLHACTKHICKYHAALPRMSVNADFSTTFKCTTFKCLASVKKLRSSMHRQTSAWRKLIRKYFSILKRLSYYVECLDGRFRIMSRSTSMRIEIVINYPLN